MKKKRCACCQVEKPSTDFYVMSGGHLYTYCVPCARKKSVAVQHGLHSTDYYAKEILRALKARPQTTAELLYALRARMGRSASQQRITSILGVTLADRIERELLKTNTSRRPVFVYRIAGDERPFCPDESATRDTGRRLPPGFGRRMPRWGKKSNALIDRVIERNLPAEQAWAILLAAFPIRTYGAIYSRVYSTRQIVLPVPRGADWSLSDDSRLTALSRTETAESVAETMGRTLVDVMCRAHQIGITLCRAGLPPVMPDFSLLPRRKKRKAPRPVKPRHDVPVTDDDEAWMAEQRASAEKRDAMRKLLRG